MSHPSPSVLVVDDNRELAENIAEILELEGIDSQVAIDGISALTEMERTDFDLVVTDIRMPGMDGVELLRNIHERWPAMPVIAMSAYVSDATLDAIVAAGAVDLLHKPVECDQVVNLIRRLAEPAAPILVLEDDAFLRANLTETLLRDTDAVPYAAPDVITANRLIDEVGFRVALVDVRLPDGSGLEFCRVLKERFGANITIVLMSAYLGDVDPEVQTLVGDSTNVQVLEKPFASSRLISLLQSLTP